MSNPDSVTVVSDVTGPDAPTEPNSGEGGESELILGTFENHEQLERAYVELRSKMSSTRPEDSSTDEPAQAAEENPEGGDVPPLERIAAEYAQSGELTTEHRAELTGMGIPDAMIDTYLQGLQAQTQVGQYEAEALLNVAGGEEAWNEMNQWAAETLPESEVDEINTMLDAGGAKARMAVEIVKGRYEAANGSRSRPRLQSGTAPQGARGFESMADMVNAMSDPRYGSSPDYRAEVERRINNSPKLFK